MPRIAALSSLNRPSNIREVNTKYFFALEGIRTEVEYIKALISTRKTNAHIFYFYKRSDDVSSSNLANITNSIMDIIAGTKKINLMYEHLVNIIFDAYVEYGFIISKDKIKSKIEAKLNLLGKKIHDEIEIDVVLDLINNLSKTAVLSNVNEIVKEELLLNLIEKQSTYAPGIDKIIIIGDRDKESFVDSQYDYVLEKTKENNITLIISNPCIEFWFLLHHTDALAIDKKSWITDSAAASKVIEELKKYDPRYRKKAFNSKLYIDKTNLAIRNSKNYCSNLSDMKNSIGTNMPELLEIIGNM